MSEADLRARKLLMSSYLYYVRDNPVLSDSTFDKLCKRVAFDIESEDFVGAGNLSPLRLFMLGSADEIRSSTYHVWISQAVVDGAESWYKTETGRSIEPGPAWSGVWNDEFGLELSRLI